MVVVVLIHLKRKIRYFASREVSEMILAWRYRQLLYQQVEFKNDVIMEESRPEKWNNPKPLLRLWIQLSLWPGCLWTLP